MTVESKKITMGRPQKNKRVKDSESSSDSEVEEVSFVLSNWRDCLPLKRCTQLIFFAQRTPPPKKGKVAKKQVSSDSDSGPDDVIKISHFYIILTHNSKF